ncbi:MAG: isochorismatase family protein [Geobacteraceae bacterium]
MEHLDRFFVDPGSALLMVIDIQEKLCKAMDPEILARSTANVAILLETAEELSIPVLVTEQYPAGLGPTVADLKEHAATIPLEKMSFSSCGNERIATKIAESGRKKIIVTGMETHICVYQTVLDLLKKGYDVQVINDAVVSRKKANWKLGLNLAAAAGAVVSSTETILFQLLKQAGTAEFKKLSKLVR